MRIYLWSALRIKILGIVDLRKGVFELKDWVPDKDILGSPLRYEGLRKKRGVDGLVPDSAPPTAGKRRRINPPDVRRINLDTRGSESG